MSQRIDKSWVVFASVESDDHSRCVDVFWRPDQTFGFEEFRRDVEDGGAWTPVQYFSGAVYASSEEAYKSAEVLVPWFAEVLADNPSLRKHPPRASG
ncbi:MAG: hypothetical protein J0I57_06985 [Hyphomicrobium sp.]|nr:hypothetical protein [Hyphomicrobium sp.]ODT28365.1 MAG: hypothetical protein ABS54_05515 [Hyphomicrobium sp. SCN 65-11]